MNMEQRVRTLVCEQLLVSESLVTADAVFVDDLGADSLDRVELVINLEHAFGIEITDEESEKIVIVRDVFELIKARSKRAA